jgi:hypothetical protein
VAALAEDQHLPDGVGICWCVHAGFQRILIYGSLSVPPHTLRVSPLPHLLFPNAAFASVLGVDLKSVFLF